MNEQPGPSSSSGSGLSAGDEQLALFAVVPLDDCPHLTQVLPVPESGLDPIGALCAVCSTDVENWVCLTCYQVNCGRYVGEHALMHCMDSTHPMALSFADLSVWCYPCEAYVHNSVLLEAKTAAHRAKFGHSPPSH